MKVISKPPNLSFGCDVTVTWFKQAWRRVQWPHPFIDKQITYLDLYENFLDWYN